jgi:hypothetical protein
VRLAARTARSAQLVGAVRPGVTHLERVIAAARRRAEQETCRRLAPILTGDCKARLDGLLTIDAAPGEIVGRRRPAAVIILRSVGDAVRES